MEVVVAAFLDEVHREVNALDVEYAGFVLRRRNNKNIILKHNDQAIQSNLSQTPITNPQ